MARGGSWILAWMLAAARGFFDLPGTNAFCATRALDGFILPALFSPMRWWRKQLLVSAWMSNLGGVRKLGWSSEDSYGGFSMARMSHPSRFRSPVSCNCGLLRRLCRL